nr:hypothetical protein [Tanacetum cinerariifolium]
MREDLLWVERDVPTSSCFPLHGPHVALDTRHPLLDRTDFASWKQWIRLYCQGKDNEVNILKSIDEGPYKLGTFRETLAESTEGTPQPPIYCFKGCQKTYTPSSITTPTRKTWDNVKMLLEGSELTKEDKESQLFDDFEHFRQHKEESIHDYYVSHQIEATHQLDHYGYQHVHSPGLLRKLMPTKTVEEYED